MMTKALKCKNPNAFLCMWIVNCRQVNGTHANCRMNRWDIFPWFMTNKKCNGDKATSTHHVSIDNTKRIFQTNEHSKKKLWSTTTQKHLTATLWRFFSWTKKKQQHRIEIYLMPQWKKQWTSRFFWYVNEKIMDDAKKSTSNTGSWFSVNGMLDASNALKKLRWRCLFRFMHCCMSMHSWNYG